MKKEKKVTKERPIARFKHGTGVASWKLGAAVLIALAIGIGGGIVASDVKNKPAMSDHDLGFAVEDTIADADS